MDFQIKDARGSHLELNTHLPLHLQQLLLPAANPFCLEGSFGSMLFQNLAINGFEMWFCHYFISEPATFGCTSNEESLELHTMLRNNWQTNIEGLNQVEVKQHQFNLTYLPFINCKTEFSPGIYTSFDIHYTAEYLQNYIFLFPALEEFLKKVDKQKAAHLFPQHEFASSEILSSINQMLRSVYKGEMQKVYFNIKAEELLFLALSKSAIKKNRDNLNLKPHDLAKIHDARSWLEQHIDTPTSLSQIAKEVGLNEFKLKKGYKEVFGTTVFDYLLKLRMERAKLWLLETNKQVTEISYLTGYSSISSFTNAFTKYFGYSPMYLRKK